MNNSVAETIARQIGRRSLMMIGAKNLTASENSLSFKVMSNENNITHIKVELTKRDDYKMTFFKMRGTRINVVNEEEGLYYDNLNDAIRVNTGLETSLF